MVSIDEEREVTIPKSRGGNSLGLGKGYVDIFLGKIMKAPYTVALNQL